MLEGELERLGAQVEAAERHIRQMYEKLQTDASQMESEIRQIEWILDERDEASFDFYAGEAIFLAAQAEWLDGRDNPDGILYLTDQRLVFEQKEKTGKKLGLFGGKQTQEVEWEVPLNVVEKVEAENQGFLGGKDMLHFTFGTGAAYPQSSVEVKGSANCKFWAAPIQRMINGDVANERAIEPDPDLVESLRNAPTGCHVCGGLLPQIVAGQNQITCEYCGAVIRI